MTDVIVLGLDGATWDVLDPLIEDGHLPNIRALKEEGYAGDLESTYPPITAPAWLSMATGQNPGKTGVFYFLNRTNPDSFDFEPMGVNDFRGQSFWDVLDGQGVSSGIFNFPMLQPPYEIDGFMISGFGADADEQLTAPASLRSELDEITGGYEVKVPYADQRYAGRPSKLADDLHGLLDKQDAAMEHLLTEKSPDVFFGVVSVIDWAQHYFWRYQDATHVLHEPGHDEVLTALFQRVDEVVGRVADVAAEEDATLLLVSDHGFGPVNGTFYVNEWLEREGFRVPIADSPLSKLRSTYFPYLRRALEPIVGRIPLLRDVAARAGRSFRATPLESLDTEKSVAFAAKQGLTSGLIYMVSEDPVDRDAVVDALRETCSEQGLSVDVVFPDDLYHGPRLDCGPDVIFEIEGLEYAIDPRYSTGEEVFEQRPPASARSGGHRHDGIYLVSGPNVKVETGPSRSLLDIAPTILALASSPIPEEMDGSPMTDAFSDPNATTNRAPLSTLRKDTDRTGRDDADAVRDRLEDLGYL